MKYSTIRELSRDTNYSECTIRNLIRKFGLPHYRLSNRGKIMVEVSEFQAFMDSQRRTCLADDGCADVLRELAEFCK